MSLHAHCLNQPILNLLPENCGKMLDIGCGHGEFGFLIRIHKKVSMLFGIDIWKPYLLTLNSLGLYDGIVRGFLPFLPFKPKFDIILCIETIEHLPKANREVMLTLTQELLKLFRD